MPSCLYAIAPDNNTAIISSEVATGRKMNRREGFTSLVRRGRFRGGRTRLARHLRAVAYPVETVGRDN